MKDFHYAVKVRRHSCSKRTDDCDTSYGNVHLNRNGVKCNLEKEEKLIEGLKREVMGREEKGCLEGETGKDGVGQGRTQGRMG